MQKHICLRRATVHCELKFQQNRKGEGILPREERGEVKMDSLSLAMHLTRRELCAWRAAAPGTSSHLPGLPELCPLPRQSASSSAAVGERRVHERARASWRKRRSGPTRAGRGSGRARGRPRPRVRWRASSGRSSNGQVLVAAGGRR
jgi:hypothetical protein